MSKKLAPEARARVYKLLTALLPLAAFYGLLSDTEVSLPEAMGAETSLPLRRALPESTSPVPTDGASTSGTSLLMSPTRKRSSRLLRL